MERRPRSQETHPTLSDRLSDFRGEYVGSSLSGNAGSLAFALLRGRFELDRRACETGYGRDRRNA